MFPFGTNCSLDREVLAWKGYAKRTGHTTETSSRAPHSFLHPLLRNPPRLLKCLTTNTFFSFLLLAPLICCSFICCHGFQIEVVEEARTFSILQVHRESTGYGRQGKNIVVMWSTSHCSASWTKFTYIN